MVVEGTGCPRRQARDPQGGNRHPSLHPKAACSIPWGRVYRMDNGMAEPFRDGAQTPFQGNIVYYGQHATAACCRKCIEIWHGIPRGRQLTDEELDYLAAMLMVYVLYKMPEPAQQ